jgi:hypothetical protein
MRSTTAVLEPLRAVFIGALACGALTATHARALDLYTSSDAMNIVHRYNGSTGAAQSVLLPSFAAAGQLAIHFGQAQNRVLVGHFIGGVEEFNATTGAYIKTYDATPGVHWAGIYGPNGNVILGNWNTGNVSEYDSGTGLFVQTLTNVASPADMVIGPNGNLFICAYAGGYVKEVNATNGAFVSQWSLPAGAQPNDIAFNPNGEILVTAMVTNVVYRYDAAHNLINTFTNTNWGNPHGIAISPWTGNVLVIDGVTAQVHEFNPTTYVEITPTFLSPSPAKKIVDLDFFVQHPIVSTPICLGDVTVALCPCGNIGALGRGCASSSFPGGALLTGAGTASVGNDTFVLRADDIPGPALFIQSNGLAATPIPFGDGLLCTSVGITRLGVVFPTGTSAFYPGGTTPAPIHVAGNVSVGNTKHYQCWYRSVPALCGPGNYNLTQGLTITWGS